VERGVEHEREPDERAQSRRLRADELGNHLALIRRRGIGAMRDAHERGTRARAFEHSLAVFDVGAPELVRRVPREIKPPGRPGGSTPIVAPALTPLLADARQIGRRHRHSILGSKAYHEVASDSRRRGRARRAGFLRAFPSRCSFHGRCARRVRASGVRAGSQREGAVGACGRRSDQARGCSDSWCSDEGAQAVARRESVGDARGRPSLVKARAAKPKAQGRLRVRIRRASRARAGAATPSRGRPRRARA
jgi:hypothetical protein